MKTKMTFTKTKIAITHQGAPIVKFAHIHRKYKDCVLIYIDMKSKYCEHEASFSGDDFCGVSICATESSVGLKKGVNMNDATHIRFDEFNDGWSTFATNSGKYTISVCLIKNKIRKNIK